jgi:homoserine/homoserine lactone efflux protein
MSRLYDFVGNVAMTTAQWIIYLILLTTMVYCPGPMTLFIMANGIHTGYRLTFFAIIGGSTAYIMQMLIVACGVGILLQQSEIAFLILKYTGAFYLVYLGVKQIQLPCIALSATYPIENQTSSKMYLKGFLTGITNPKAILVFTVLFPQFINTQLNKTSQLIILGAVFLVMQFISATLYALVGSKIFLTLRANNKEKYQNLVFGIILITVGLLLATMKIGIRNQY